MSYSFIMDAYDHKKIEKKWQGQWQKDQPFRAKDFSPKPKFYGLIEFPYPSGRGLHTGHIRSNTAMDIVCRKRRMEGYEVLYPIGWDAFGLPTENYAIKTGRPPVEITKENTDTFRRQLKSFGFSFDWSREVNTSDPNYYKWTQWIFLQLLKAGLAYKDTIEINWCPSCKIGLANEEAVGGKCDRCEGSTEKRQKEQWMLAITKYADRLDRDLDKVNFLEKIKIQQRNWIGRSEGHEIEFRISNLEYRIKIFTTRLDTIYGATYLVLAPEHPLIQNLESRISNLEEIQKYKEKVRQETEIERLAENKEKTGVEFKGVKAINPASGEEIPIWIADYVLAQYGTGAIMAVPAHDERDFAFAKKFNLPIVIVTESVASGMQMLMNSGTYSGLSKSEAIAEIEKQPWVTPKVTYKLRDWVFSRQRYWGEPIPVIHCLLCGIIPLSEDELPLTLPPLENYRPRDDGESPLASVEEWVNVTCPTCGAPAKRETDTMPNWAGSSWYYLRYLDADNDQAFVDKEKLTYWSKSNVSKNAGPVDWYNGGMEHTTLHLLYSRFWHKFLFDQGFVPTEEPYTKRTSHGLVLAEGGAKMSKSKGNVVNPDELVQQFGADAVRLYEMFMAPFDQAVAWDTKNIVGVYRFLEKVWRIQVKVKHDSAVDPKLESLVHQTVKKVGDDIEAMKFNTAVSALMILTNAMDAREQVSTALYEKLVLLLSGFAPHLTEELWHRLGHSEYTHETAWPSFEAEKILEKQSFLTVQVNGKMRALLENVDTLNSEEIVSRAKALPSVQKWIAGKEVTKVVFVPGKFVNLVLSDST